MFSSHELIAYHFHLFLEINSTPEMNSRPTTDDNKSTLIAAILTPILVIIITTSVIVLLWRAHKRKIDFMDKEMEIAVELTSGHRHNYA